MQLTSGHAVANHLIQPTGNVGYTRNTVETPTPTRKPTRRYYKGDAK
jgi:hypothetical protein